MAISTSSLLPPIPGAGGINFAEMAAAHYEALRRYALRLTRCAWQSADLTQQTFYILARRGGQIHDSGKVRGWLFTTLYREFLRERRRGSRFVETDGHPGLAELALSVDSTAESAADTSCALRMLKEMDETFRQPMRLFYLDRLTYLEIAGRLAIPVGTVMSRLSRGRAELRAKLGIAPEEKISSATPKTLKANVLLISSTKP